MQTSKTLRWGVIESYKVTSCDADASSPIPSQRNYDYTQKPSEIYAEKHRASPSARLKSAKLSWALVQLAASSILYSLHKNRPETFLTQVMLGICLLSMIASIITPRAYCAS